MTKPLIFVAWLIAFAAWALADPQFVYSDEAHIPKGANHKTLRPAIHWDHDRSDLSHLIPSKDIGIYYTENGRARPDMPHQFTHMDSEMEHPGVVLEHSQYVNKVTCRPGAMKIHFTAQKAWSVVRQNWNEAGGFIIVEHSGGCGTDQQGQKVYWLAKSVTFDNQAMVAHVRAQELEIQNALANVKLMFGMWQPQGRPDMLRHSAFDFAERAFAPDGPVPPYMKRQAASPNFKFKGNFQPAAVDVSPQDSCGTPLAPGPGGLPSAACGTGFDRDLDDKIGYLNFTSDAQFASSLRELAPNLDDYKEGDYTQGPIEEGKPTPPTSRRSYEQRELLERGFFGAIGAWFARAAQTVVNFVVKAANEVAAVVREIATIIGEAVSAILEEIGRFIVKGIVAIFGPEVSVNLPIKAQAAANADSSFGRATQIGKVTGENENGTSASITLYCVRCGINGNILFFGRFEFKPGGGALQTGEIGVMGSLTARLVLGLEAQLRKEFKHKQMIVELGLPGFSIPKLITVGPVATLSAASYLEILLTGSIQAGAEVSVGPFASVIDLVHSGHSGVQNFTLTSTPVFSAAAKIDAYLRLGLPISIGFGVVIPILKFEKTAAIVDEPYISSALLYEVGNKHIDYKIFLGNRLVANVFDLAEHTISDISSFVIAKGTIPLPGTTKRDVHHLIDGGPFEKTIHVRGNLDDPDRKLEVRQKNNNTFPLPPETPQEESSDFAAVSKMALAEANMYNANPNGASVEKFGFSYTQIFDSTGNYHLTNEDNGNFGLKPATASNMTDGGLEFEVYKKRVVSDYGLRLLHFYEKEMNQYQVSRFRLADPQKVPADARMVILQAFDINVLQGLPASNTTDPLVYLAVDTGKNVYFPITCSYSDDQASKVFLAKDAETGPEALMNPNLQHTVTGGDVQECIFVPFIENGGPGDEFGTGLPITHPP